MVRAREPVKLGQVRRTSLCFIAVVMAGAFLPANDTEWQGREVQLRCFMSRLCLILVFMLVVFIGGTDVYAQASQMKSEVIVRGYYGEDPDQYGYPGIEDEALVKLVPCYTVTDDGIYIFDGRRSEVKIYTRTGNFVKALETVRKTGQITQRVNASDISVRDGNVYLLMRFVVRPKDKSYKWTEYQVFPFEMSTGNAGEPIFAEIEKLGRRDFERDGRSYTSVPAGNTVFFAETNSDVLIFDRMKQLSYPLIRSKSVVPQKEMSQPLAGCPAGSNAIRQMNTDKYTTQIALVDESGNTVRTLLENKGVIQGVSIDGNVFVVSNFDHCVNKFALTVYDTNGNALAATPMMSARNWGSFEAPGQVYRVRPDGTVYEIFLDNAGVHLVAWTR